MNGAEDFEMVKMTLIQSMIATNPKTLFSQMTIVFIVSFFIEVFYPN